MQACMRAEHGGPGKVPLKAHMRATRVHAMFAICLPEPVIESRRPGEQKYCKDQDLRMCPSDLTHSGLRPY